MGYDKKTKRRPKNRQTKQILVFDEKSREEYLTGFRKRKNERRKYAQEKAERQLLEEKRELKRKRREFMDRKVKHQYVPPDLAALAPPQVTDLPQHTVTVTDISAVDLAGQGGFRLGLNQPQDKEENDAAKPEPDAPVSSEVELSQKKKQKILKKMGQHIQQKSKKLKVSKTSYKKFKKHSSKKQRHKIRKPARN